MTGRRSHREETTRRVAISTRAVDPTYVDALGVSAAQWEQVEGGLFGASLVPYLGFLYFLQKPESECPSGALFGFKFLLAFVFGTIPFAIYAKVEYDEILANVDVLHGVAESLLTMTSVFVVLGFRQGLREAAKEAVETGNVRRRVWGTSVRRYFALWWRRAWCSGRRMRWRTVTSARGAAWDSTWRELNLRTR